jgi:hypothetical protein
MSRFPVALAVAAGVAAAALPASAEGAVRAFRSPTGNLGCMFSSDADVPRQVRCEWKGGNDRAVQLTETGKGKRIKITDTVFDPGAKVLAYGKSTTFGRLKCTSRESGITCKSSRSKHGFTVSVQKQRVF